MKGARTSSASKYIIFFFWICFVRLLAGGLWVNRNDLNTSRSTETLAKQAEFAWPIMTGLGQTVGMES